MSPRSSAILALLLAPFALWFAVRMVVVQEGAAQAAALLGVVALSTDWRLEQEPENPAPVSSVSPSVESEANTKLPRKASSRVRGILVRRSRVLQAVRAGIRPTAQPVQANASNPAGLVVYGWGAAGVGLVDGDIITHIGGRVPTSVSDVVGATLGAYQQKSYSVSGRVWRNGQVIQVTVELPLPEDNRADEPESPDASAPPR